MHIGGVLRVYHPRVAKALPLLVDSPHSGRVYPDDFGFSCPRQALQVYEDRFVDLLLSNLPHLGVTTIQAEAPRTYIDLNRAVDDIWPMQLRDVWNGPFKLRPSVNCDRGTGLIWTHAGDQPIYREAPTSAAVLARIETQYWPYYEVLGREVGALKSRFGKVWHLNMHSMPPHTNNGQYDVVLGDLDGTSCDPAFTNAIRQAFEANGLSVVLNRPYKGAHLTRTVGQPDQMSESLQIELSKGLYLQNDLITLNRDKFMKLQNVVEAVVMAAAVYAKTELSKTAGNDSINALSSSAIGTLTPKA
ncbi:MAG: N-formylglutamate amidohydrolase [Alphaproteobacteria bacterium]|nr:N-formylglutamate amidohydrolase [Alphaproteobacteria bacterium]